MTIRQLPDFAFRSAADYAAAMDRHPRPLRPGARAPASSTCSSASRSSTIFRSTWFSAGARSSWSSRSSSARSTGRRGCGAGVPTSGSSSPSRSSTRSCRTGRRWPASPRRRGPRRPSPAPASGSARRRPTGTRYLYGDRHQYTKLATLFTHLGLILFLVAAAVTSRLGDEQGLVVAEGELADGPADRDARPAARQEPRLRGARALETGQADRLHDGPGGLPGRPGDRPQDDPRQRPAVGRRLHVPPERLRAGAGPRRSATPTGGRCGTAPVPLTDQAGGLPYGTLTVPGPRHRAPAPAPSATPTASATVVVLPYRVVGDGRRTGRRSTEHLDADRARAAGEALAGRRGSTSASALRDFGEYTLLIAKRDPGQGIVWLAFVRPDRRHHDHVLPAAPADLGPRSTPDGRLGDRRALRPLRRRRARVRAAARRPRRGPSAGPTGLATARGARARWPACATSSGRSSRWPARSARRRSSRPAAEREVGWVRVLKARVPAFDALEAGDLAIIPGPALGGRRAAATPDRRAGRRARRAPASRPSCSSTATAARTARRRASARPPSTAGVTVLRARPDGPDRPRAERHRLPRQPPRRARPAGGATSRRQLARLALLRPGPRRAGRGDRGVPRPGRRHRGPARRPDRGPRARRAAERGGRGRAATSPTPACGRAAGRDPGPGRRARSRRPARPPRRRPAERAGADRAPTGSPALLALELARDEAVRQAREETRRGDPLPADGPPWVVLVARQARRRRPRRHRRPRGDPRRAAAAGLARRLVLRGTSESLELRLVAAAPPTTRTASRSPAGSPAFLGRIVAVSRPFNEPGARPAAEAAARATLEAAEALDEPPRSPARRACRPTCCWATCATCPTGCARPGSCWRRSSSARRSVQRERLRTLRGRPRDRQPRRGRRPARRPSQHDRLPGRSGSRRSAAGTCPTRSSGSACAARGSFAVRTSCKMHNDCADAQDSRPVLNRNPTPLLAS